MDIQGLQITQKPHWASEPLNKGNKVTTDGTEKSFDLVKIWPHDIHISIGF